MSRPAWLEAPSPRGIRLARQWLALAVRAIAMGAVLSTALEAASPPSSSDALQPGTTAPAPAAVATTNRERTLERDILLRAARNSMSLGQIEEACRRFEALLARFPDTEEGRREYAGALARLERLEEATVQLRRLLETHPREPELRHLLAELLVRRGHFGEALAEYDILHQQDPKNPIYRIRRAQLPLWMNDLPTALERFQQLAEERLDHVEVQDGFVDCAAKMGKARHDPAVWVYERMMARPAVELVRLQRLAWVMREVRETAMSVRVLERATGLAPNDRWLRLQLAEAAHELKDYDKAEKHYAILLRTLGRR